MGSFGLILDVQKAGNDVQFDASTDSQASFSTVSDWLNRCLTTHTICHMNSSATPPTRVVHIPESGSNLPDGQAGRNIWTGHPATKTYQLSLSSWFVGKAFGGPTSLGILWFGE